MRSDVVVASVLCVVVFFSACGGGQRFVFPEEGNRPHRKTCLVLSVGGPHGIAHIGAIKAIKERELQIDCVGGASMGALVGALYANRPEANLEKEVISLLQKYVKKTRDEKEGGFIVGALLIGGAVALSGGAAIPVLLGGAAGGLAFAGAVDKVDLKRFASVLNKHLKKRTFDRLAIPLTTFHVPINKERLTVVAVSEGKVAGAVKKSIANPMSSATLTPSRQATWTPGLTDWPRSQFRTCVVSIQAHKSSP